MKFSILQLLAFLIAVNVLATEIPANMSVVAMLGAIPECAVSPGFELHTAMFS